MKWGWITLAVIVLLVLVGVVKAKYQGKPPVMVTLAKVTDEPFLREVSGTGNVDARIYTLTFPRPGRIARVAVREGDHVAAGAVLAELDIVREQEDLAAAHQRLHAQQATVLAQREESKAALQKIDIQLADAQKNLRLTRKLYTTGGASHDEVTTLTNQVATLQADRASQVASATSRLRDAEAQITNLSAEIQGLERTVRESKLFATVAGVISQVDFRVGETAQGGVKLVEDGSLKVKARLAEADTVGLRVGQPARIELDADPDHPLQARVTKLGVAADVQGQGSSSILPVTLVFLDPHAGVVARPGFTVTARITTLHLAKAIQVPLETLVEEDKDGHKVSSLWVVDPVKKSVSRITVTVSFRSLLRAVVKGVPAGAQIVSLPPETLKDGDIVKELPKDAIKKPLDDR